MNIQRINWIDWSKAICIFFMVCGHSYPTQYIHDFIYQFHLPVFFIISGLLYKVKDIKTLCISLLIPVVLWNMINYPWYLYNLINSSQDLTFNSLFLHPILGLFIHDLKTGIPICGPFWFVIVIFIMRIYQQIISNYKCCQLVSIIISIFIAYISNGEPQNGILFILQRAAIAYPFFYIGTYLKRNTNLLNIVDKNKIFIFPILLCILIIFPIFYSSFDLYSCKLNIFPSYYIIGCIGFVFIYLLTNFISYKIGTPKCICNISNGTLVVLGLHNITLFTISKLTHHTSFTGRGELFSILTMIILYIPTTLLTNYLY